MYWNDAVEPFYPGIGMTNTTPLQPKFVSLFAFWYLFQNKNSAVCMCVPVEISTGNVGG
jgi:hypothetical protein